MTREQRSNVVACRSKVFLLSGLGLLLSLSMMSCADPSATYILSGTLTKTGVPDGVFGYVKLVVQGGAGDAAALFWDKSSPFISGTAAYSIAAIAEGSYTGYAFIDTNGDAAGDGTSMPDDIGDWETDGGGDFTIDADQTYDLPDGAWIYTGP
jgi:hypothetical protein